MLIENDNHFHTLYVVVRLSALYKKTWILIRLMYSDILYNSVLHIIRQFVTYVPVEKLWKNPKFLWKTCGKPMEIVDVTYITPTCKIIISL